MKREKIDASPLWLKNLLRGDREAYEEFVSCKKDLVIEIILHLDQYNEFQDKLPIPGHFADLAFEDFRIKLGDGIEVDTKNFIKKFIKNTKAFVRTLIFHYINTDLKKICEEIHNGSKEAEKRLLDYEKDLLVVIQHESSSHFPHSDHIRISERVINQFINQVKRNGVNDNNGEQILKTV